MSIAKKDWWVYTVWTRQCDVFSIQTILWRLEHSDDCFPKQESCCFTSASCEKDATKDELRSISLHTLRLCQQITDVKRGTLMSCDQPLHVAKVSKQTTINDDVSVLQECFKMSHDVSPSFVNSLMDMGQQTVQQPDFWPWRFFHKNWSWSVFLDAYFPTKQRGYCAGLQLLYTSINFLPLSSSAFEQKANAFLEKTPFLTSSYQPLRWRFSKHRSDHHRSPWAAEFPAAWSEENAAWSICTSPTRCGCRVFVEATLRVIWNDPRSNSDVDCTIQMSC